jgi:sugar-specific transcriptional regulator TrmB
MDKILSELGLSDGAIAVYTALLEVPNRSAQQLASETNLGRTNIYRILETLESQKLIIADDSPVKKFSPADPEALKSLVREQQLDLKRTGESLISMLPQLRSQYALATGKPGVVHLSGDEGFLQLVEAAVASKTEVLLFASSYVPTDKNTLNRFRELLLERKQAGVRTRALFYSSPEDSLFRQLFSDRGIELRFIDSRPFTGEVSVYENNVVFATYEPSLVTTVITSEQIADTMRIVFEELWKNAKP